MRSQVAKRVSGRIEKRRTRGQQGKEKPRTNWYWPWATALKLGYWRYWKASQGRVPRLRTMRRTPRGQLLRAAFRLVGSAGSAPSRTHPGVGNSRGKSPEGWY